MSSQGQGQLPVLGEGRTTCLGLWLCEERCADPRESLHYPNKFPISFPDAMHFLASCLTQKGKTFIYLVISFNLEPW